MSPLFAIGIGPVEIIVVSLVILLLFGNRLPGVMRSMGRGIVEFKKGVSGIEDESNKDDDVELSSRKAKAETKTHS